jgi:putative transposase
MKFNKGFKYRIYPNKEQEILINKNINCSRFVYNYILGKSIEHYKVNEKSMKLSIETEMKSEFDWLKACDSICLQQARLNLQTAYKNFFKDKSVGFPKFKSKRKCTHSYRTINQKGTISIEGNKIKLPKLGFINIKLHRELPLNSKICSATINEKNNKYYVSVLVEYEKDIEKVKPTKVLGLDYSQADFYVDSENRKPNFPKPKRNLQDKLSKEQRKLARKVKGSNNRSKQRLKVAKLEEHIANQRKDFLHKLSKKLTDSYDVICVEDLDLRALSQCLSLGKNISDNGFGEFRVMLNYKSIDKGKYFVKIDKWYPSSKTCNSCGYIHKDLKLSDREWDCINCGVLNDRDFNASLNIKEEGFRILSQELAK